MESWWYVRIVNYSYLWSKNCTQYAHLEVSVQDISYAMKHGRQIAHKLNNAEHSICGHPLIACGLLEGVSLWRNHCLSHKFVDPKFYICMHVSTINLPDHATPAKVMIKENQPICHFMYIYRPKLMHFNLLNHFFTKWQ